MSGRVATSLPLVNRESCTVYSAPCTSSLLRVPSPSFVIRVADHVSHILEHGRPVVRITPFKYPARGSRISAKPGAPSLPSVDEAIVTLWRVTAPLLLLVVLVRSFRFCSLLLIPFPSLLLVTLSLNVSICIFLHHSFVVIKSLKEAGANKIE